MCCLCTHLEKCGSNIWLNDKIEQIKSRRLGCDKCNEAAVDYQKRDCIIKKGISALKQAEGDIQKNCYDAEGLRAEMDENGKTYYHYVSDEQGSVSHIIRGEDKESGVSEQGRGQGTLL